MDLALPRRITRAAFQTLMAVPRIVVVLTELRDAVKHLERLATFAAEELPEIVYQLESVREQLAAIERRLGVAGENGHLADKEPISASRDGRRSGSPRPS